MGRQRIDPMPPTNGKQIDAIKEALLQASENSVPIPSSEELEKLPQLLWFLSPALVDDPKHRGSQKPPKVLREPLLLVSWDRGAGRWKWAISDKTLNLSMDAHVDNLLSLGEQIEAAIVAKKVRIKNVDPTRRVHEG